MTRHQPYYVRKGWVDEEGQIRVIESSLKIMHMRPDVHGEDATDHDTANDSYTYPPPNEHTHDHDIVDNSGYFYLGEMLELLDFRSPSPVEDAASSPLISSESSEEVELASLATVTASNPNIHFPLPSASTNDTYPLGTSNIYSQSLPYTNPHAAQQNIYAPQPRPSAPRPDMSTTHNMASTCGSSAISHFLASRPTPAYHNAAPPVMSHAGFAPPAANMTFLPTMGLHNAATPTLPHASWAPPAPNMTSLPTAISYNAASSTTPHAGFAPPAPNMALPYGSINRPTPWTGYSTLSLPNGSRVGQPTPVELQPLIDAISNMRQIGRTGHPERRKLKKPYDGTYEVASRDEQIIRDHFASGSGLMRNDSPLRAWYGDLEVFSAKMWEFLVVQKSRVNAKG